MTKTSTLSEAVLKNVKAEDASTGLAVASVILSEANRREHLNGGVQSVQWERSSGIGILVDDEGQMKHLANALSLTAPMVPRPVDGGRRGVGRGRTGTFLGYKVTVWWVEV